MLNHRSRVIATLAALALLATACGGNLTDDEILRASGMTEHVNPAEEGVPDATTDGVPDVTAADPSTSDAPSDADASAPGVEPTGPRLGGPSGDADTTTESTGGLVTTDDNGPIVIGSVGNYSGPAGSALAGLPRGVQTWAAKVNSQGGLFGREVRVIVQDDGGDPARYAAAVRDLVENRGAIAFVGNGATLSMTGGDSYLRSRGIPVIGSDCALPAWFNSPVYFPQCTTYDDIIINIMRAGHELSGKRRFGYVTCTESEACTGQKQLFQRGAEEVGVSIVYAGDISLTQVDFTAQCRNAQEQRVELFYVGADPNTLARVARSCERQGFRPQYVQVGLTVLQDSKDLSGVGDMIVSLMFFPFAASNSPAAREFYDAFETFVGGDPGPADASGWASAKLFEKIATDAAIATRTLSPSTLIDAGRKISGENLGGLTTDLDFTSGKATPRNCYFAMQAKEGQWTDALGGRRCV